MKFTDYLLKEEQEKANSEVNALFGDFENELNKMFDDIKKNFHNNIKNTVAPFVPEKHRDMMVRGLGGMKDNIAKEINKVVEYLNKIKYNSAKPMTVTSKIVDHTIEKINSSLNEVENKVSTSAGDINTLGKNIEGKSLVQIDKFVDLYRDRILNLSKKLYSDILNMKMDSLSKELGTAFKKTGEKHQYMRRQVTDRMKGIEGNVGDISKGVSGIQSSIANMGKIRRLDNQTQVENAKENLMKIYNFKRNFGDSIKIMHLMPGNTKRSEIPMRRIADLESAMQQLMNNQTVEIEYIDMSSGKPRRKTREVMMGDSSDLQELRLNLQ